MSEKPKFNIGQKVWYITWSSDFLWATRLYYGTITDVGWDNRHHLCYEYSFDNIGVKIPEFNLSKDPQRLISFVVGEMEEIINKKKKGLREFTGQAESAIREQGGEL